MRARQRGFSMIELLVVLSIIGIAAGMAIPALGSVARTFRSRDQAQEVLSAVRAARSLSQKRNEPVQLRSAPGSLNLYTPTYVGNTDGYLVAVDTSGWELHRRIALPDVKVSSFPAEGFTFCPSGEARFRESSVDGASLCGLGDLAAPGTTVRFEVLDVDYEVPVNAALASASLRRGH